MPVFCCFRSITCCPALDCTAEVLPPDLPEEELPRLALRLALRSYADKLACERILGLITPPEVKAERRKR